MPTFGTCSPTAPNGSEPENQLTLRGHADQCASENVGGSGSRFLLIQIKDKDWKPSTGLS